jgi:hypothetical protein
MRKGSDLTKPLLPNVSPSVGPTGGDLFPEEKRVPLNAQCLLHAVPPVWQETPAGPLLPDYPEKELSEFLRYWSLKFLE